MTSGLLGLFLSSFLAATILPLSSEGVLSYLIYNKFDMTTCLVIASIGNTLGGMSSFYLGKLGKLNWIEKVMKISMDKIHKTQNTINKFRSLLAFFCWLPVIGDVLAVSLGYFKCKVGQVFLFMFAGKALRYLVWAYLTVWSIEILK